MHFIVTGADHISNSLLRRERYVEYMLALHRIFSYGIPVFGVLSEYELTENSPPFSQFPFTQLKTIPRGYLKNLGKSQAEFKSIKELLKDIPLSDDEFIIKIVGRYMLVTDDFVNLVKKHDTNPNVDAVICEIDNQQRTYLYAMRYKYFKELHSQPMIPAGVNIEKITLDFIKSVGIYEKTIKVQSLGILANTNNQNDFAVC
jgi:hypothetical protein